MKKSKSKKIKSLEQKIASRRQQLQEAYDARGYTDSTVLSCSIKLDKLINRYLKMTMMKKM